MTTATKNVCSYALLSGKGMKHVDVLIDSAIKSAKTMKMKVQVAAVAILQHAEKHGDYSKANVLVDGLGHGVKADSLVAWFVKFGGLIVDEEGKGFGGWKGSEYIKEQFTKAKANAWYDEKKGNAWAGFNLLDELAKVVKKEENARKKVKAANDAGDADEVALLEGKIQAPDQVLCALQIILRENAA